MKSKAKTPAKICLTGFPVPESLAKTLATPQFATGTFVRYLNESESVDPWITKGHRMYTVEFRYLEHSRGTENSSR